MAETAEGNALMGRNFDMYYSPVMLVKTTPDNGYRSLTMVNLAYLGYDAEYLPLDLMSSVLALAAPYAPMDGMNEKGLAVSVMQLGTAPTDQQTDKIDVTTSSAIRMMLYKAATVEEVVALLQQHDMHASAGSCYHFLIADANGDSAVVEYVGDEISVLYGERACTNFMLTEGEYDFGSGYGRYATVQATLAEHEGVLSRKEAMDLLETCNYNERAEKEEKGEEYIPDGEPTTTQWSCVYDLDALTVDIAVGADWSNIYTYSLLDW